MNNDNTELLKFIELHNYDLDRKETKLHVDSTTGEITIEAFMNRRTVKCEICNSLKTVIKDHKIITINHPIKPNTKITIYYQHRKFRCNECKHSFWEKNPFTPFKKSTSTYGIIQMLNSLRNPRKTFQDVANESFTSIQNVMNYFDEYVSISEHRLSKVICFDEIYSKKLTKTKYAFCMFDPMTSTIINILDARRKNVLEEHFARLSYRERAAVQYVNIDMWKTYVDVAEQYLPNATICVDSFHVIEHLNKAMDKIRLRKQREFLKTKDTDKNSYYWLLKTFHYYFTENFDNIKYECKSRSHYSHLHDKHQVLHELLSVDKDLKEAYDLKEEYREFNLTEEYSQESITKLEDIIEKFKKSPFQEFKEFGFLLSNWKYYICNSFIRVNGKRMSNGPMESVNGRTKRVLSNGYGFNNFERFKKRVMFALNKDEPIKIKY